MSKIKYLTNAWNAVSFVVVLLLAPFATVSAETGIHKIVMQISSADKAAMNLVLNNVSNMYKYYLDKGEEAKIEIVAFGPGLNMLRKDKSPVAKRVNTISQNYENVSFKICNNTLQKAMKQEKKKHIPLLPQAQVVPAGAIHIIQRQEEGWAYLKP